VAKVVEAERSQSRPIANALVASAERRVVQVIAGDAREDQVVRAWEEFTAVEPRERLGDGIDHRHRTARSVLRSAKFAVGVAGAHPDRLELQVDIAPAECQQLAHTQAGERRG
jgi:xanthine/CO dehydrogenase XdhC/CoxF family maturation factor